MFVSSAGYRPDTFERGDRVVSWTFPGTGTVTSVTDDGQDVRVDHVPSGSAFRSYGPEDLRKDAEAPVTMALASVDRIHVVRAGDDEADYLLTWRGDLVLKGDLPPSPEWLFADPLDCGKADQVLASQGWARAGRWVHGEENWTAVVRRAGSRNPDVSCENSAAYHGSGKD